MKAAEKPTLARAQLLDAIGQAQKGTSLLGIMAHLLKPIIGLFGLAVHVHLNLVELVSALDAAHIAAGAHLLTTEARGVSRVAPGQAGLIQDLVHVQASEGNLSSRHKIEILFMVLVQVVGKFGELTGAEHRLGLDHERQVFLGVSLANVQVEHERDQGPLEAGARAVARRRTESR